MFDLDAVHHARKRACLPAPAGAQAEHMTVLTRYLPKVKARKEKSLLSSKEEFDAEELEEVGIIETLLCTMLMRAQPQVIVSHWHGVRTVISN